MRSLTPIQNAAVLSAQTRWLGWIFSTEQANREQAEEAVRQTYRAGGVPEPEIFLWFDDLVEALLVREQLSSFRDFNSQLPPESLEHREEIQHRVREKLGLQTWDKVVQAVGPEHCRNRHETRQLRGVNFGVAVRRTDTLQAGLRIAVDDHPCDHEVIEHAAARVGRAGIDAYYELAHIVQRSAGPGIPGHYGISLVTSFYDDYRYEQLFRHDCLLNICGDQASAAYNALRRTVQHAGPWWAFRNGRSCATGHGRLGATAKAIFTATTDRRSLFGMEWNFSPGTGSGSRPKRFDLRSLSMLQRFARRAIPRCVRA